MQQDQMTVNLRFVVLGAFLLVNGALLSAVGYLLVNPVPFNEQIGLLALAVLTGLANTGFWLLEERTIRAHAVCMRRGRRIMRSLGIQRGIYWLHGVPPHGRPQRGWGRGRWPGHGRILETAYAMGAALGLAWMALAYAYTPAAKEKGTVTREDVRLMREELQSLKDQIQALGGRIEQLQKLPSSQPRVPARRGAHWRSQTAPGAGSREEGTRTKTLRIDAKFESSPEIPRTSKALRFNGKAAR